MASTNKIVFIGNEGVGKTSFIDRYRYDTFNERSIATIGASYSSVIVDLEGEEGSGAESNNTESNRLLDTVTVRIGVWDVSGNKRYSSMLDVYLKHTDVVVLCYDSVPDTKTLSKDLEKHSLISFSHIVILLTKVDRSIKIKDTYKLEGTSYLKDIIKVLYTNMPEYQTLRKFCQDNNLKLFLTSAKLNYQVQESFVKMARLCYETNGKVFEKIDRKINSGSTSGCCFIV